MIDISQSRRKTTLPPLSIPSRVLSIVAAGLCLTLLLVASNLDPDGRGHSTHEQLGLASCSWPTAFNAPCPMCGMTTATCHAAHGDVFDALQTQPAGAAFAIFTSVAMWTLLHAGVTGSRAICLLGGLWGWRIVWIVLAGVLIAWAYKAAVFHSH